MAACLTPVSSFSPPRPGLRLPLLLGALRRRSSASTLIRQKVPRLTTLRTLKAVLSISCSAADRDGGKDRTRGGGGGGGGEVESRWAALIPRGVGVGPEKVLRLIAGATSSPICQFIESPRTFLHSVDPRIKLVMVFFSFLVLLIVDCTKTCSWQCISWVTMRKTFHGSWISRSMTNLSLLVLGCLCLFL